MSIISINRTDYSSNILGKKIFFVFGALMIFRIAKMASVLNIYFKFEQIRWFDQITDKDKDSNFVSLETTTKNARPSNYTSFRFIRIFQLWFFQET